MAADGGAECVGSEDGGDGDVGDAVDDGQMIWVVGMTMHSVMMVVSLVCVCVMMVDDGVAVLLSSRNW